MESDLYRELQLRYQPVAVLFADDKPAGARQFKEGARGCVIGMLVAAAKGQSAAFDRKTFGCMGGGVGLCFGDTYASAGGGIEYFLSTGRGEGYPEGEGYKKTVDLAREMVGQLPKVDIPYAYVVFKPLSAVDPAHETPQLVCFLANPDQLSALVVLANYGRPGNENVIIPFASGCQTTILIPYLESQRETPRAVVGNVDISARPYLDPDILTFTAPYALFLQMEADAPASFLSRKAWQKVKARLPKA
jgi:uncharacterized protein (DUF169 family)